MDEEIYESIKEDLAERLGREPTEDEIVNEFSSVCDWAYEQYKDDLLDQFDQEEEN